MFNYVYNDDKSWLNFKDKIIQARMYSDNSGASFNKN